MTQDHPGGPAAGPAQVPPPYPAAPQPGYEQPGYEQSGYEQSGYQPAPPPGYGPGYGFPAPASQKTNVMAILGLVFAFLFSPLGLVFSAIGMSQTKKRGEGGRGLAIAGLIVSILSILLGILMLALVVPAVEKAAKDVSDQQAASVSQGTTDAAGGAAQDTGTVAPPAGDTDGVVGACKVILPALLQMEGDVAKATTPSEYAASMQQVDRTLTAAAATSTDPAFVQSVQQLAADFQKAADTVQKGKDPSALESTLSADGSKVGDACDAAGYTG